MIRDLINIYHKREMLNVPCPSCQNFGHSIIKCPLVNYVPNKALILDHFKRDNFQRRRRKTRKQRKKIDSRIMKQKINLASDILTMRYPELSENKCEESSFYLPTDPKNPLKRISIFGTSHNTDNILLNEEEEEKVDTLEKVENFKNQEVQGQMLQSERFVNQIVNVESAQSCFEMKKSSVTMNENNLAHKFDKNRLKMFDSPTRKSIME